MTGQIIDLAARRAEREARKPRSSCRDRLKAMNAAEFDRRCITNDWSREEWPGLYQDPIPPEEMAREIESAVWIT